MIFKEFERTVILLINMSERGINLEEREIMNKCYNTKKLLGSYLFNVL